MAFTLENARELIYPDLGVEAYTELTAGDRKKLDSCINSVYADVYFPANGITAEWTEQNRGAYLPAPTQHTVTVTQGARSITGLTLADQWAGCVMQFSPDEWNIYGGHDSGGDPVLLNPFRLESGSYQVTVYYNCFELPNNLIQVQEAPELQGKGVLFPLEGDEHLTKIRSLWYGDFAPQIARSNYSYPRRNFDRTKEFATGDPYFYFVSSGNVRDDFQIGQRFVVYPLPDAPQSIQYQMMIGPPILSASTDVIHIPEDLFHSAFVHLVEQQVSFRFADYDGRNQTELNALADKANLKLRNRTNQQKRKNKQVTTSPLW